MTKPPHLVVDVLVPAVDEASGIPALFDALDRAAADAASAGVVVRRVVLADNGSADGTPGRAAARGAVVVHEPRRGYGAACLRGLETIARDPPHAVVFLDADLADDPGSLPILVAPIAAGRADLVIGSRVARADPGALSAVQRFGNRLACAMMFVLGGRPYTDLGPFRAIRHDVLEALAMRDRTWGWTVEMQMKAALLGLRVAEVDVPYRRRRHGRSKISGTVRGVAAVGSRIIATILLLWWRRKRVRADRE